MQSIARYKIGQYVTTPDGLTGCIFEMEDEALRIAICEQ